MRNRHVLIIGDSALRESLKAQYLRLGAEVTHFADDSRLEGADVGAYDEFVLLPVGDAGDPLATDGSTLSLLERLCESGLDAVPAHSPRPVAHVQLLSDTSLWLLRNNPLAPQVTARLEVNPFTLADEWARTVAMGNALLGIPTLDRGQMTLTSERTVHVVLFGATPVTEQVAINVALVAHYPGYLTDKKRRTRITIVDTDAPAKMNDFRARYEHLFANSYYRFIDADKERLTAFHEPQSFTPKREEFVDVEWEFVNATLHHDAVREKLLRWAADPSRLLTLFMTHASDELNVNQAMQLPEPVLRTEVPVMVHVNRDEVFGALRLGERFCHIVPFGMRDKGYDVGLPLLAMAKNINYVYNQCYNDHGDDTSRWRELWTAEIDRSRRETAWRTNTDLCPENRFSNIALAMTVSAKMRALGIADSDMRKFQDVTLEQIEVLAQVEHNRWSVDKLIAGFRPCTTDEQRAIESDISLKKVFKNDKKAHYDLRAYNDLRADDTDRSSEIYDKWLCASLPLIAAADDDSDGSTEGGEQP